MRIYSRLVPLAPTRWVRALSKSIPTAPPSPLFPAPLVRILRADVLPNGEKDVTINPKVYEAEYAVRGLVPILAGEIGRKIKSGEASYDFDRITYCNIGNPQYLGQKPLTFLREVLALLECEPILDKPLLKELFSAESIERARSLLKEIGSPGAYTESKGLEVIRKHVAEFIQKRDNIQNPEDVPNANDIFLTTGASEGIKRILELMYRGPQTGVMIPIPQYPLYSAALTVMGAEAIHYYLDETKEWSLNVADLEKGLFEARSRGVDVRALCVINPGNPTGQSLSFECIRDVLDFCYRERLVVLADEVYQENIYYPQNNPFHSFYKVMLSMGPKYRHMELFSFHSVSKGFLGECGRRGGYLHANGIDENVRGIIDKQASIALCANVQGQVTVDVMVKPPSSPECAYLYNKEASSVIASLKRRADMLAELLNSLEGVSCNPCQGAMYLFPRVRLPPLAIERAAALKVPADTYYAVEMLKATGVCVVPGSGFLQEKDTYHFRITYLPLEHEFPAFLSLLANFHRKFYDDHRSPPSN